MEKIIKIGKQEVRLSNNTAWTIEYRDQFGKDIVPTLMPLIMTITEGITSVVSEMGKAEVKSLVEVAEVLQGRSTDILLPMYQIEFVDLINITWAMAKAANEDILPPKQWIKQFDSFPVDVVAPAVYDMALKGFISSKNLKRLKTLGESIKNLQSDSMTLSSQESNGD